MREINPYFEILHMAEEEEIYRLLELAYRTCWRSEDKIKPGSAEKIIRSLMKLGHETPIEHSNITVRIVCDRGIMAELTRHRLNSFSVESTRYANYGKEKFGKEITVIRPFFWAEGSPEYKVWKSSMDIAEKSYLMLLDAGAKPQEARSVLPQSLKTELITTANIRTWKHIFNLRCSKASHPQIRQIMLPLLDTFYQRLPVLFETQYEKYQKDIIEFAATVNTGTPSISK